MLIALALRREFVPLGNREGVGLGELPAYTGGEDIKGSADVGRLGLGG